jgi:predicted RNA-binding Zn-ribbon protein involved in translation (DUF1610 family)
LALVRELLHQDIKASHRAEAEPSAVQATFVCPHCGGPMIVLAIFARGQLMCSSPRQAQPP